MTMRLVILSNCNASGRQLLAGAEVDDLPDGDARILLRQGKAERAGATGGSKKPGKSRPSRT